jgi:dTDP-4-dehydrorhamnose 3,5-epimerase
MSPRLEIIDTALAGLKVVQRRPLPDARGYLERMYCAAELAGLTGGRPIAQINRTLTTRRGVVRGMHFQHPPHGEFKLVSCLRGAVFDVAVDIRAGSPDLLRSHAELLSADNHRSLLIPPGFAHGFQALTDDAELLYLHTAAYVAAAEGALNARDPALAIEWPEPITGQSERDRSHALLTSDFAGVRA